MPRDELPAAGPGDDQLDVQRCLAGSVEAFEPIVRRNASRLMRLSYHLLGDWEEARDLAQETFARAYLSLGRYDSRQPFRAWLCTIAARLAADRLRHRRAWRRARERMEQPPRSTQPSSEAALSLKESLRRLTSRQRQAVVLCDLHGFTAPEAAAMIGCSASTVRVLRFLARRRLAVILGLPVGAGSLPHREIAVSRAVARAESLSAEELE